MNMHRPLLVYHTFTYLGKNLPKGIKYFAIISNIPNLKKTGTKFNLVPGFLFFYSLEIIPYLKLFFPLAPVHT